MMQPYGHVIFCDDIRQEVGQKSSYMGCYRGALVVHHALPITLPQLGIVTVTTIPLSMADKEMTFKIHLPGKSDNQPPLTTRIKLTDSDRAAADHGPQMLQVHQEGLVKNLRITSEGPIRVTAAIADQEISLGSLDVKTSVHVEVGEKGESDEKHEAARTA